MKTIELQKIKELIDLEFKLINEHQSPTPTLEMIFELRLEAGFEKIIFPSRD